MTKEEFSAFLDKADVPVMRRNDFRWLSRNLWIRNSYLPGIAEAILFIKKTLEKCDTCNGSGVLGRGFVCHDCQGTGKNNSVLTRDFFSQIHKA